MARICVIGNSVIDVIFPKLLAWPSRPEERLVTDGLEVVMGGNALNTTAALVDCGLTPADICVVTAIGQGHRAMTLRAWFAKYCPSVVEIDAGQCRAGTTVIRLNHSSKQKEGLFACAAGAGAEVNLDGLKKALESRSTDIADWEALYLSYGMFGKLSPRAYRELVQDIKHRRSTARANARKDALSFQVILDCNLLGPSAAEMLYDHHDDFFDLLREVDYFIPDEHEAIQYLDPESEWRGRPHRDTVLSTIGRAVAEHDLPCCFVVKRADRSVLCCPPSHAAAKQGEVKIPPIGAVQYDSVGAGDAWAGCFLSKLLQIVPHQNRAPKSIAGHHLQDAIRNANIYASASLGHHGGPAATMRI